MQVTVTVDGEPHDVDVSMSMLTLQESCDLEDALGSDGFAAYQNTQRATPKVIRAILWAKLRRQFPDIAIGDFDLDLSEADIEGDAPGPFDNPSSD